MDRVIDSIKEVLDRKTMSSAEIYRSINASWPETEKALKIMEAEGEVIEINGYPYPEYTLTLTGRIEHWLSPEGRSDS